MTNIHTISGNIFDSKMMTIVNTVNCVGFMGAGIALEYSRRYPEMNQEYIKKCKNNEISIGELFIYKKSSPWILNFPTKMHYKDQSSINIIQKGLQRFIDIYKDEGIQSIAFPQLGSSLGGLNWEDVRIVMMEYLEQLTDIEIEIYEFDPSARDELFETLIELISDFTISDYKKYLNMNEKVANQVKLSLGKNIRSMRDFEHVKGIGDEALKRLYKPEDIINYQERFEL